MIKFSLEIKNPLSKDRFKDLGCISGKLTKNKSWELQHTFYDGILLDCTLEWTRHRDHAGLEIVLGTLGYGIHFSIYDNRHWDYVTGQWVQHD